ncbi:MAG: helix-turn-helix transcriptional regulator [bacterium]|nr:helix-turn-helix transcriptional regulator [bacterium]MDY4108647.1 helix-turn-helix transcriptional regulator [Bacilli bacterium]MDY4184092.1 helix-turn-helix transcriptional regulator [Candidatus Onthovivens sp.]
MFYKKNFLENMSQGARLKFIRENKGIELNDIAEYLGYKSNKPIREWENNVKSPDARNLPRLAEAYGVCIDAIKKYDFIDPIDEIYYPMWFEEQFPYYEFDIDSCRFGGSAYNFNVQNGINEWLEMRKKRENHEITDQEYIEWKLNYKLKNPLK